MNKEDSLEKKLEDLSYLYYVQSGLREEERMGLDEYISKIKDIFKQEQKSLIETIENKINEIDEFENKRLEHFEFYDPFIKRKVQEIISILKLLK